MLRFVPAAVAALVIGWSCPASAGGSAPSINLFGDKLPPDGGTAPVVSPPIVPPPAPSVDACAAGIAEHNGIVSLTLNDAARAGRATTVTFDEVTYAATFDRGGNLAVEGPIFHAIADVGWTGTGGNECHRRGIAFSNYDAAFWVALVWPAGQVGLALHVVEPEGRLGGSHGYVSPERPDPQLDSGRGSLRLFGGPVAGTSQVQLYSVEPARNPRSGFIYTYVEFASRGNPAAQPFCGADPLATAKYRIFSLDHGQLNNRSSGTFPSVPCGTTWSGADLESSYYQRRRVAF